MKTLTYKQWVVLSSLLPRQNMQKGGRPRADDKRTLEAILWILKTGAQWSELPKEYGSYVTAWRRLRHWEEDGTWERIWKQGNCIFRHPERSEGSHRFRVKHEMTKNAVTLGLQD